MKRFAFVSRHAPTLEQTVMAEVEGIELVNVGDRDAFTFDFSELQDAGYDGVVVVHPAAAVRAFRHGLEVGVFEKGSRAAVDGKPTFYPVKFWVYEDTGV